MKTSKGIIIFMLIVVVGVSSASAQSKQERKERREQAVKEQIESGNYKISVATAYPRRGRTVQLTSSYSVEVRNDSVISYLPYYGRAYSIPYGGGDGLIFKAPIEKYEMKMDKKGVSKIEITTKTNEDKFRYSLMIHSSGSASINVNMQNRESISFQGEIE